MSLLLSPNVPHRQRGVALMVVLVLLLVMTLLGLASLRGTLMGLRMSANSYDRNLSFQSAESALRQGEAVVAPGKKVTDFTSDCTGGLCSQPVAATGTTDRWLDHTFVAGVGKGWTDGAKVSDAAGTPQYFVEYMGTAPAWTGCDQVVPMHPLCLTPRYRITARNADPKLMSDRSVVILQSNYAAATP